MRKPTFCRCENKDVDPDADQLRGKAKKNMCVSGYPTYPIFFPAILKFLLAFKKKNELLSYTTYPICGHFLLVLPLSLSYMKLYCCLYTCFD